MTPIYTAGIWIVKPGQEAAFREAWAAFARTTQDEFEGAISALLLEDAANPRRFISVGPWRSQADIDHWRGSKAFSQGLARMKPLLESFEPGTFTAVVSLPGAG